ncbi:hypothetical protein CONPUDRAFT_77371 [Coniophora puteana RWD-64-598 SS2]|uniref:BTB domain-containing protein n=1 Tax=Coniophora puteana (strain RWD-64-598) TaxID=741705 RepID=A0A5M3M7R0_CONPW|nr:uncharacterized protein CONPUDRAFT_77371 [Coniophora puteana RWD-64-598 SS2]EIW75073.1 hypothetical protein CONPUDRAFT_77371 [Coniophora puteana RWD-64-598 SS2]
MPFPLPLTWAKVDFLDYTFNLGPPDRPAEPPFDDPEADIILRSSDNVTFRVFKSFLACSSTVLGQVSSGGSQVIDLSAHSSAVRTALLCCYPDEYRPSTPLEPAAIADAAEVALVYGMPEVTNLLRQEVACPHNLQHYALEAFSVCKRFNWNKEGREAALHTLSQSSPSHKNANQRLLDWCSSKPSARQVPSVNRVLSNYYSRCGKVASRVGTDLRWPISYPVKRSHHQCDIVSVPRYGRNNLGSIKVPVWLAEFVEETKEAFLDDPDVVSVLSNARINSTLRLAAAHCTGCCEFAPAFMHERFIPAYKTFVQKALNKVSMSQSLYRSNR